MKFKDRVISIVKQVPYGKVASYSQIALIAGIPRAARQVGNILNGLEDEFISTNSVIPWWRVLNNSGRITIKGTKYVDATAQKNLLEKEGIVVNDDFTLNIALYRYIPSTEEMRAFGMGAEEVQLFLNKFI